MNRDWVPAEEQADELDDDLDDVLEDDFPEDRPPNTLLYRIFNWIDSWVYAPRVDDEPVVQPDPIRLPPGLPGYMPDDFQPVNLAGDESDDGSTSTAGGEERPLSVFNLFYAIFLLPVLCVQMIVLFIAWQIDEVIKKISNKSHRN